MAAIIRFNFDVSKMKRRDGCCTAVVGQNKIHVHQQQELSSDSIARLERCLFKLKSHSDKVS